MLRDFTRMLSGPVVERIIVGDAGSRGDLPQPSGDPHVHAMGPDPDRIVMIGGGPVRGVGVASYELSIGGYLARKLSALTGRGADVELLGVPGITVGAARRMLTEIELPRFDAVVVMLGAREALGMRPAGAWSRDIRSFLDELIASAPPTVSVFVVGLAPLPTLIPNGRLAPMVGRQVDRLNAGTSAACAATGAYYIPFDPDPDPGPGRDRGPFGDATSYASWAEPIAAHMYRSLDATVSVPTTRSCADEALRQAALDSLDILGRPPTPELEAVARVAKDLFGVAGAAVNLIDRDRQHTIANYGFEKADRPRSDSFCSVTVDLGGALVVEDARRDARFNKIPAVVADGVLFYAGYPIEAPNGQRIGTLCLFDGQPRTFTSADRSLLRELALRVQAEIWAQARTRTG